MNPLQPKPGDPLSALATPVPVIDEDIMAGNIARAQSYMDAHGIGFRPHIKTHKIVAVAAAQRAAGARGINCQKVTEAEIFADAGFDDILITYNILGSEKLARLVRLNERTQELKVTADSAVTVAGLADAFRERRPLAVLVECDTGGGRCGVQTPAEALSLARQIAGSRGLAFGGLMTFPKPGTAASVDAFLSETIALLKSEGIACPIVSNGGTPGLLKAHEVASATEHRAGTYVYNDRAMVRAGHCTFDQCAMRIIATVVSRPAEERAVIDAGSKTLTSDLFGFADFGHVLEYPDAVIVALSEEHGVVDLSKCAERPTIGERIGIIPNHTCVVSNLFDEMIFHRSGRVTRVEPVAARGMVW